MQEIQVGLHVKCLILFSILNKLGMCRKVLMELSSVRFHENRLCGLRVTYSHVDKHDEGNTHIFATFCWERGKNEQVVVSN
jgi:hypothetical protein